MRFFVSSIYLGLLLTSGCGSSRPAPVTAAPSATEPMPLTETSAPAALVVATAAPTPLASAVAGCVPADWSARALGPLLEPGKTLKTARGDRPGSERVAFPLTCGDSPAPARDDTPRDDARRVEIEPVVLDGVELRVVAATPAGSSGRGWAGNRCTVDVRLADGSGATVRLGATEMPPFTSVTSVVRAGSAVWLSVTFNGYTREFPKGGNRVIALDLCDGRVVWQSKDSMSNGGLLLLDDYLISAYGFTSEPRFVFVLDARSGAVVQKLPVVENVCPSKSWAPNWRRGDRCDAPGQRVGAATTPRIEDGLFLVDTNTGSATFQLK
ncbi:MAG: hypothetical protein ABUL60_13630 [Myxococcales bacterium]